jgi:hypothetical protein
LPQAQAAPASPCDLELALACAGPTQRGQARRPLSDQLASARQVEKSQRDSDHNLFEAAARARRPDPSGDLDLDPSAALLLRVEPARQASRVRGGARGEDRAAHHDGLLRLAAAALGVVKESHLTLSKNPASDSRPLIDKGHKGTPVTDRTPSLAAAPSFPPEAPRDLPQGPFATSGPKSAAGPHPELRPIDGKSPADRFAGRKGKTQGLPAQAALLPVGGEDATQLQER